MLGNSRFLIIVISVLLAFALISMGASARDPVDIESRDIDVVLRRPPQVADPVSRNLFDNQYMIESNDTNSQLYNYPLASINNYRYHYVYIRNAASGFLIMLTFDHDVVVNFNVSSGGGAGSIIVDDVTYPVSRPDFNAWEIRLVSDDPIDISNDKLNITTVYGLFNFFPALSQSIFSVGNSLVSFVVSSWYVLVPVVAFVCILGFGVIRRLVKGV